MREATVTTKVYTFEELNDDAKEAARNWWRECSLSDEWWEYVYEDAETIGLKITSFDEHSITGEFVLSSQSVINAIKENHGKQCETYKTAMQYNNKTITKDDEGYEVVEDDLIEEFLHSLLEDYRIMLNSEYDNYFSDEHVDECITINEYEFTESGNIY